MEEYEIFISIQKAVKRYGISAQLLRRWDRENLIESTRTPGNVRLFNRYDLEKMLGIDRNDVKKKSYIYCRVSSDKQKNDLFRQEQYLRSLYPAHDIITDVGSGINFKRKGLQTILDRAIKGLIGEVVVAYKDRLARFGFDLIEYIIKKGGGRITVLDKEEHKSSDTELAEDLLSIVHVFNCRQMGKRRYCHEKSKSKNISDTKPEKDSE